MPAKTQRQLFGLLVLLAALAAVFTGAPANAERLRIIPLPPNAVAQWTPMPDLPQMYYAPNLPTDVFRHRGRYYLYWEGVWYRSRKLKGPWWRVPRPPAILNRIQAAYFKTGTRGGAPSPGGQMVTPEGRPVVPPPSLPSPPAAPAPPSPPSEAYAPPSAPPVTQEPETPSLPGDEDRQPPTLPPATPGETEPASPKGAQPPEPDTDFETPESQEPAPLAVPKGALPKAM